MKDRASNLKRAREISNQINRLSLELERILQFDINENEEAGNTDPREIKR